MTTKSKKTQGFLAVCAVMMLAAVVLSPALVYSDNAYMEGGSANITLQPGQAWEWTPEFPAGLDPALTVSVDGSEFGTSAGWASIRDKTLYITVPEDADGESQTVTLRAETTMPTQVADYVINVTVQSMDFGYSIEGVDGKITQIGMLVGESYTLNPSSIGPGTTYELVSGILPDGIEFDTSNGMISGTPTSAVAPSTVTVRATSEAYMPVQSVITEISIGVYDAIHGETYTVYAIAGETNISIPGFDVPEDVIVGSFVNTINGEETLSKDGMSVSNVDDYGVISGTPTTEGTYTFVQTIEATALTGGSKVSRTITVDVDEKITLSGDSSFETIVYSGENYEFTATGSPALELTVTADGIVNPESYFRLDGNQIIITAGPGVYNLTIKATVDHPSVYEQYSDSVISAMPEDNCAELMVTITIGTSLEYNGPTDFYTNASGSAYDQVDFMEFISGADDVRTETDNPNYSIGPGGFMLTSSTEPGDYTVTVTIIDNEYDTNRIEVTMNVHVVPDLAFENDPSAGFIVGASA